MVLDKKKDREELRKKQRERQEEQKMVEYGRQKGLQEREKSKIQNNLDALVDVSDKLDEETKEEYPLLELSDFATSKLDSTEIYRLKQMFQRLNIQKRMFEPSEESPYKSVSPKDLEDLEDLKEMNKKELMWAMLAGSQARTGRKYNRQTIAEMWSITRFLKSKGGWLTEKLNKIISRVERSKSTESSGDEDGGFLGIF